MPERRAQPNEPQLRVFPTAYDLAQVAGQLVAEQAAANPESLMCFAAGGTPSETYAAMARHASAHPETFRHIRLVQLDEWCGLPAGHPGTCRRQIHTHILLPLGIAPERFCAFRSDHPLDQECERVRRWLDRNGPIDLCVLGLGINGHLGFNEPGDFLVPRPHIAQLSEQTLSHPMVADIRDRSSLRGITLGIADLLQSQRILLLVSGIHKRPGMQRLYEGKIDPRFPASMLWLHPNVTILCTTDAAGDLSDSAESP